MYFDHTMLPTAHLPLLLAQADPVAGSVGGTTPTAGGGNGPGAGAGILQIVMFAGIFAVFYFLVLRPQQKRAKQHKAFLDDLKVGGRVVTSSGIYGTIVALKGNDAEIEIAKNTVIRVLKSQIAGNEANASDAVAQANPR
jgi:preprotein translocase subunit YajC